MRKGPEAQGQHTLRRWPKANLLCDTQVMRCSIDGGVEYSEEGKKSFKNGVLLWWSCVVVELCCGGVVLQNSSCCFFVNRA